MKKPLKTGDRFKASPDLENNEERILLKAGNRQLSRKLPEKDPSP